MKNSLRRIFALALVVMMIAALGMSAAAEGEFTSISFDKTLSKDAKAYAPYTDYSFNVAAITAAGDANGTVNKPYAGPVDAITISKVESRPEASDITKQSVTDTGTISVDITEYTDDFKKPGIYRYTVTEATCAYAGVTSDTGSRVLDVYIASDANGAPYVAGLVMYENGATLGTTDNKYSAKGGFNNVYSTTTLTVSKTVAGNLGDQDKEFTFTVTIEGAENEQYYIEKYTSANAESPEETKSITATKAEGATVATASTTVTLEHGEHFIVHGLSKDDKYTVSEDNYSGEGYIKTVTGEETGTIADAPVTVAYTNTKSATVPTGIAMTVLPFVAMIALAAIVAVLFFQKRERREA